MDLKEKIEQVLDTSIRSKLTLHQGGVEVVSLDEKAGVLSLRFTGMCEGCSLAGLTFQAIVENELLSQIPKLKKIEVINLITEDYEN